MQIRRRSMVLLGTLAFFALVGALAWHLRHRHVGLIAQLDAQQTMFAVEITHLDELPPRAEGWLKDPPPSSKEYAATARILAQSLGFDPSDPSAWQKIGIDLQKGAVLLVDRRLLRQAKMRALPRPVLLVAINDRTRLLALLKQVGLAVEPLGAERGIEQFGLGDQQVWLGMRGQMTALMLVRHLRAQEAPALRDAFRAFLQEPVETLETTQSFQNLIRDTSDPYALLYANFALAADALFPSGPIREDMQFFAARFPAFAWHIGEDVGFRLQTSPAGHAPLQQTLLSDSPPLPMAQLLPASGWAIVGFRLNFLNIFAGSTAMLPPSTSAETRASLADAQKSLTITGLDTKELAEALRGDVLLGFQIETTLPALMAHSDKIPNFLLLLSVRDRAKADALLAKLSQLAAQLPGLTIAETELNKIKRWQLTYGNFAAVVARVDDRLVVTRDPKSVELALGRLRADSLADTPMQALIDGPAILRFSADMKPLVEHTGELAAMVGSTGLHLPGLTGGATLAGFGVTVEKDSVVGRSPGDDLSATFGAAIAAVAAVAIPAFDDYTKRAQAEEAPYLLDVIKKGAAGYYAIPHIDKATGAVLPCEFPPTTELTPHDSSCCEPPNDNDGDGRCDTDLKRWDNPTWIRLRFAITDRHYFRYKFESSGTLAAATFTATAYGDLDCDGIESTFQLVGHGNPSAAAGACGEIGTDAILRVNETE